jgi:Carboxypeptidase regulatory-like domain/TonB-dependent Receptor Plug Domain
MLAVVKRLSALLAALFFTVLLNAQTITGTLRGHVIDVHGAVVANAKIVITNEDTGLVREATTDAEGNYILTFVPLGRYEVSAESASFQPVHKRDVAVELNKTTVSDFRLQPGSVTAGVTVTGEAPFIDVTSGEVKEGFDAKTIQDRPLPTRNFLTLAEVIPGFQTNAVSGQNNPTLSSGSSVQLNGTGTRGASFQVDGVNNDDSSENQNRQGVNISSIAEVQVLRNNFSAEFGRSYGTVVLVQTKSGTNKFHGDTYWFHVNSATTANEFFRNAQGRDAQGRLIAPVPVQRRHQYGFTLGGPIKQNKLFFYNSFDQVRNGGFLGFTEDILLPTERTPDPSVTDPANRAWIQGIIDRFPNVAPNSPASGPRAYTTTRKFSFPDDDYTGRVDWNINNTNTIYTRYQYSDQDRVADDIIKGERADQHNGQQNVGINFTHIYSPRQTGELRLGVGRRRTLVDIAAGNDTPVVRFSGTQNGSIIGNAGAFPIHRFQTDYQFVYNHFWAVSPKLSLKFGTDNRLQQLNDLADNFSRGFWTFTTVGGRTQYQNFLRGFVTTFQKGYGPFNLGNRIKEFNLYAQADVKVRQNFTLNLGVRNEMVRTPREVHNLVNYGYDDRLNNFEPRIGFAYSPDSASPMLTWLTGGPGKFVVRGGGGLFHGRLFQSYFSQSGATIRFNPPNAAFLTFSNSSAVADPTNGFVFVPGPPTTRISPTQVDPNLRIPYTEQWNLTVERELPASMALSASYVGNHGVGLPLYDALNRAEFPIVAPNDPFVTAINRGVLMNCIDPDPTNLNPVAGCISQAQPRINDRRPDPRYSNVVLIHNGSSSYYHGLQMLVSKRYSYGLSFQTAYTWSKAIDTGSEATSTGIDVNFPLTESGGARTLRGVSLYDTPHRLTVNYSYEFPFFKSQQGVAGHALGGWQLSGTTIFASGNPFTVFAGYDLNADGIAATSGDRPDLLDTSILGRSIDNGRIDPATGKQISILRLPGSAFAPSSSTAPRPFRPGANNQGTLTRNTFRAAGQNNWDTALAKYFKITESTKLMFRWEMYNAFNRVQFGLPNQTVTSTTFARISSQRNNRIDTQTGARYMQFALRLVF